jgi:hypothetical protein
MIKTIGERSQILKEAVAIATGVDISDFLNGNTKREERMARRLAVDLYFHNLGFMGTKWIGRQLGIEWVDHNRGKLFVSKLTHEYAQHLYDKMVKEAS